MRRGPRIGFFFLRAVGVQFSPKFRDAFGGRTRGEVLPGIGYRYEFFFPSKIFTPRKFFVSSSIEFAFGFSLVLGTAPTHKKRTSDPRPPAPKTTTKPHPRDATSRHNGADHAAARAARADRQRAQSNGSTPARHPNDSTEGNGNANEDDTNQPDPQPGHPARRNHDNATRRRANTGAGKSNSATRPEDKAADAPGTSDAAPPEQQPDTAGDNGQKPPAQARAGSPGNRNHTAKTQRQRGRKTPENTAHTAEHLRRKRRKQRQAPTATKPPHGAPNTPRRAHRARRRPRTGGDFFPFLFLPTPPPASGCGDESLRPLRRRRHNGRPVRRLDKIAHKAGVMPAPFLTAASRWTRRQAELLLLGFGKPKKRRSGRRFSGCRYFVLLCCA